MSETNIRPADANDIVIFVTPQDSVTGFQPHSRLGDKVRHLVGELTENYNEIVGQILAMVKDSRDEDKDGFSLREISVGLGFDAKGKLGFIAGIEAGAEVTISIKFVRA